MSERMKLIRTLVRLLLSLSMVSAIVITTLLIVRELPDDPSAALIGLLGTIFGGLLTSLGFLSQAISSNPSDSETNGDED